jgi:hypothetical protein
MNRYTFLVALGVPFAAGLAFVSPPGAGQTPPAGAQAEPPKKEADPPKKDDAPYYREELDRLCRNQNREDPRRTRNGLLLNAEVKTTHNPKGDELEFAWTLTYTGPRPPAVVLKPTLTEETSYQTYVDIFAFPRGKPTGRMVRTGSPLYDPFSDPRAHHLFGVDHPPPEWFLTLEKGKAVSGTTAISTAKLRTYFTETYPKEFDAAMPPDLYAKFVHSPTNRGERYSIDAWTGTVESLLLQVPALKRW